MERDINRVIVRETSKFALYVNERLNIDTIKDYLSTSINDLQQVTAEYLTVTVNEITNQVKDFIREKVGNLAKDIGKQIIGDIGDIVLSNYDLSSYTIADIPGLAETPIYRFPGFENLNISQIPNLASLPFQLYPNFPQYDAVGFALVDLVLGEAEQYAERSISGGNRVGIANCNDGSSCAHIELGGPLPTTAGRQWVSGDSQRVKGGKNLLKWVGGGKEPTGRLPFNNPPFKMVLRNNSETQDTVALTLAFRYCFSSWGIRHCTPYNLFEIPLHTFRVGDYIYLGVDF